VNRAVATSLSVKLLSDGSEQYALDSVLENLAPIFEAVAPVDGERAGALLVVSDDAGAATAVQFWRSALEVGLPFASPAAFPWCLANAPCATIARRFGVTGPNVTWLASFADVRSAFDGPAAWLADYLSVGANAWVVALHFGAPARASVWYWDGRCKPSDIATFAGLIRDRMASDWLAVEQAPLVQIGRSGQNGSPPTTPTSSSEALG